MSLKYQEIVTITGVCINCNTRVADIFIPSRFMAASTHPDAWLNQKYMLKIPCSNCGHEYAKCTGSIRIAIKPCDMQYRENYTELCAIVKSKESELRGLIGNVAEDSIFRIDGFYDIHLVSKEHTPSNTVYKIHVTNHRDKGNNWTWQKSVIIE